MARNSALAGTARRAGYGGSGDYGNGESGLPGQPGSGGGGGLEANTSAFLLNVLLDSNTPENHFGDIIEGEHNLSSDPSGVFIPLSSLNNVDPRIGPLTDNAGPTLTMALLPGSPAIDSAHIDTAPVTDQRGGLRVPLPTLELTSTARCCACVSARQSQEHATSPWRRSSLRHADC